MAGANSFLAPGAQPIVGRMFEAGVAHAGGARVSSESVVGKMPARPAPAPLRVPALPFIDTVDAYVPRERIRVSRRLAVERDLYLADHDFVYAPGIKSLTDSFPVLPMTVSLEAMAETAACLVPGYGLVGFENVSARRWIAVTEAGALTLRIEAQVLGLDQDAETIRVVARIFTGADNTVATEATVRLARHHSAAAPSLTAIVGRTDHDAATLYRERHLFHGPRFHGLCGRIHITAGGASGSVLVRHTSDWFSDQADPQLLTDPALLDTVGQLVAVWALQKGSAAFPIGVERLELHGPMPAAGSRLPICMRIRGTQLKMLGADVEIGDGKGGLWASMLGWKSWLFEWAPRLVAFQRQPSRVLLAHEQEVPAALSGVACRRINIDMLKNFDLALLARHYLHASEWPAYAAMAGRQQRQRDWLLGRVAVKDAVREWHGVAELHPASFAMHNDAAGQPVISQWPAGGARPCISIAHASGHAVGVAAHHAIGVDLEIIGTRTSVCVEAMCTRGESSLVAALAPAERDAWITRLWCAKEAFAKRLGTGVVHGPRQFEALALRIDHSLTMRDTASGATAEVWTLTDAAWIIAFQQGACNDYAE